MGSDSGVNKGVMDVCCGWRGGRKEKDLNRHERDSESKTSFNLWLPILTAVIKPSFGPVPQVINHPLLIVLNCGHTRALLEI